MATIREVSKKAGVSVATVSRVVNGNQWVAEDTRNRVLSVMAELGYQPNTIARSLATNKTYTIGMVVGDLSGPFFGNMMHVAEQEVRKAGKHLVITSGQRSEDSEKDAIEFLTQRRVDALILHLNAMSDADIISLHQHSRIPLILVNRYIETLADRCVSLNNELGGFLATQHLLDLGHTEIICLRGPLRNADSDARTRGFQRALAAAGRPSTEAQIICGDFTERSGAETVEILLNQRTAFSALFAHNDAMAIGAISELKRRGLRVPEDISVIGYDDILMGRYIEPALTTVCIPVAEFGRQAARLALNLASEENFTITHTFEPELIIRQSTGRPSVPL